MAQPVAQHSGNAAETNADRDVEPDRRDVQIAELQDAVIEISRVISDRDTVGVAKLHDRIEALEAKLTEQEQAVRHVLTMLIEWGETGAVPGEGEQTPNL